MSKLSTNKVLDIKCLFCTKDPRGTWWAYFTMTFSIETWKRDQKLILKSNWKIFSQCLLADLKNIFSFSILYTKRWSGSHVIFLYHRILKSLKQRFSPSHATKGSTQTFWSCRKCIQLTKTLLCILTKNILH